MDTSDVSDSLLTKLLMFCLLLKGNSMVHIIHPCLHERVSLCSQEYSVRSVNLILCHPISTVKAIRSNLLDWFHT